MAGATTRDGVFGVMAEFPDPAAVSRAAERVRDAGFTPAQRNNPYDVIRLHSDDASPDRRVSDWSQHRANRLPHAHTHAGKGTAELTVGATGS